MKKVILDTSIVIDYTRASKGILIDILKSGNEIYIPMVVISELWAGESIRDEIRRSEAESLIEPFIKIDLDEKTAKLVGEILRDNSHIGTMDAIIAGCAIRVDGYLATQNKKHFKNIKNLKLY